MTEFFGAMGGMQCIKYLMFVFNFLFWVCMCVCSVADTLLDETLIDGVEEHVGGLFSWKPNRGTPCEEELK